MPNVVWNNGLFWQCHGKKGEELGPNHAILSYLSVLLFLGETDETESLCWTFSEFSSLVKIIDRKCISLVPPKGGIPPYHSPFYGVYDPGYHLVLGPDVYMVHVITWSRCVHGPCYYLVQMFKWSMLFLGQDVYMVHLISWSRCIYMVAGSWSTLLLGPDVYMIQLILWSRCM